MFRFIAFVLSIGLTATAQAPSGAWLDGPTKPWNRPGARIPPAPRFFKNSEEIFSLCRSKPLTPMTAEERAVASRGWLLFGTFHDFRSRDPRGPIVIGAMANMDGMCRPDVYHDFVFVNGEYAGTLSPKTMNARTDGSSGIISFSQDGNIVATFNRYTDKDPLCCPSRIADVSYEIQQIKDKPMVVPLVVKSRPAER